jgi:hypothetical protein
MALLDRLRAWWRRIRGGAGGADATDARGKAETEYECAVCGTGVDDPEGPCPLCRATDVVPADSTGGTDGQPPADRGDRDDGPLAGDRHVAPGDDASVERLRDLRADGELLERYADRWEPVDGGFQVETENGTRVVDSREEVAAVLRAADG